MQKLYEANTVFMDHDEEEMMGPSNGKHTQEHNRGQNLPADIIGWSVY